jgi:hypothetical protein
MSAYFIVMLGLYELRSQIWGRPVDAEVTNRSASRLLGRYLRHYFMWLIRPYERALVWLGVTPNQITFASLLTAGGSGWALATGHFALGGWLYLFIISLIFRCVTLMARGRHPFRLRTNHASPSPRVNLRSLRHRSKSQPDGAGSVSGSWRAPRSVLASSSDSRAAIEPGRGRMR